jgi:L-iditol 2-dehydrogenase
MIRIPKKVSFEEACFLEPVNTCLKGVDRLHLFRDDRVLIFGQGPIGLIFTQLVRARKGRVMAFDLFEERRQISKQLGAAVTLDPRSNRFAEHIQEWTQGRGADAAIIAVPSEEAFLQAFNAVRPGGKILLFAHTKKGDLLKLDAGTVCVDEKTILGSYSADEGLVPETARLIFSRKVKVLPLVTHRFPLSEVNEAFNLAAHPTEKSLKVIVTPQVQG